LRLLLSACLHTPGAPSTSLGPSGEVTVRTVLAGGDPSGAPGQRMELARYTIPPRTKLVAHHHPGMQLAYIESGALTYTVIAGTVTVHAADGSMRAIGPGQTGTIKAGEWIAETEEIVHFGANDTDQPIVILASSLFLAGQPPAIPVSPTPSST